MLECFRDGEEEEKHLKLLLFLQIGLISLMSAGPSIFVTVLGTTNWYICPLSERDRNLWFDSDQHSPRLLQLWQATSDRIYNLLDIYLA